MDHIEPSWRRIFRQKLFRWMLQAILVGMCMLDVSGKDTPELGPLEKVDAKMVHADVCGLYAMYGELASNYSLNVYPDGDAVLYESDDLSPLPTLIVSGKWVLEGGVLKVSWIDWHTKWQHVQERVSTFATKYNLYRRSSCSGRHEYFLLHENEQPDARKLYTLRLTPYIDWQELKARLLKKK